MDFTRQIANNRRLLLEDVIHRLREALRPFEEALDSFLAALFRSRLPADWRQKWHAFVADQATVGFMVEPKSASELEAWIEGWAKFCGLEPLVEETAATQTPAAAGSARRAAALRPTQSGIREEFFNQKLAEAQGHLVAMRRVLEACGQKLDAAKTNEEVDVEGEVKAIEELIWRYNDALESARDAWLRDDLSGEALN